MTNLRDFETQNHNMAEHFIGACVSRAESIFLSFPAKSREIVKAAKILLLE